MCPKIHSTCMHMHAETVHGLMVESGRWVGLIVKRLENLSRMYVHGSGEVKDACRALFIEI